MLCLCLAPTVQDTAADSNAKKITMYYLCIVNKVDNAQQLIDKSIDISTQLIFHQ